jgi:hypothetical protein
MVFSDGLTAADGEAVFSIVKELPAGVLSFGQSILTLRPHTVIRNQRG